MDPTGGCVELCISAEKPTGLKPYGVEVTTFDF